MRPFLIVNTCNECARTPPVAGSGQYVARAGLPRTGIDAGLWSNSAAIDGDPLVWVAEERARRDIVVIGSLSLVHALAAADLIDEYRLITFPAVVGAGDRLFATGTPVDFRFTLVEPADVAALSVLRRQRGEQTRPPRAGRVPP